MLKITDLQVLYGQIQALWGVTLEIKEGNIVGLLGPNGAGKTTTFNTIAGLLNPKSGSLEFKGEDFTYSNPSTRVDLGIAVVPEGRKLFPFMTVEDNLLLGSYVKRSRSGRKDSLNRVFNLFPILKERINQMAGTLSGGQQQMLAIGRGLMSNPTVLILDEPSLGLAPIIVDDIFRKFKEINDQGVTVIISEQHVSQVMEIMDFAYVMEEGKIALSGTPDELKDNKHVKNAYLGI